MEKILVFNLCLWGHDITLPEEDFSIRTCEGCHGYESLHNIPTDSPNAGKIGTIVVGGENAGYGHIGRDAGPGDSDCWGCHGFALAAAPGSGPVTSSITSPTSLSITAGADTRVTLTGPAFTNQIEDYVATSDVLLTASNGSAVTLSPDSISEVSLTVTIPGTAAIGNYTLQAVKGGSAASNPVVVSIKPEVVIAETSCSNGILTVTGSGFGDAPPEGAEEYLNAKVGGMTGDIISWTNTQITAATPLCNEAVSVNALYGSSSTCNCEGNFDGDVDQDGTDAFTFKTNFGRNRLGNPCANGNLCNGDFDCDQDVDGTDAVKMKEDFGRSSCTRVRASGRGCFTICQVDPYQLRNLAGDASAGKLRGAMEERLNEWMKRTGDSWNYDWSELVEDNGRLYAGEAFYTVRDYLKWARARQESVPKKE